MVTVEAGEYTFGENNEIRTIDYDYEIMKYEVTDQDYVLFILDALQNDETEECQDLTNGDGTPWYESGPGSGWEDFGCDWYFEQGCPDYGDQYNNDLGYGPHDACCDCGGGTSSQSLNLFIYDNKVRGYYPGDANFAAGNYDYLYFSNSKISWNGEIFEVEEGNVNHPVTGVTWFGAWAFATHYGMEIPDQYEWEKAARGNTGYDYPWGNQLSIENANYDIFFPEILNLGNDTSPVATFNGLDYDDCLRRIYINENSNHSNNNGSYNITFDIDGLYNCPFGIGDW